jgi:hypothetical protein
VHSVHLLSPFLVQIVSSELVVKQVTVSLHLSLVPLLHFLYSVVVPSLVLLMHLHLEVSQLLNPLLH